MSKSLSITLPDDIADTLDRRMGEIAQSTIPGVQSSKSAYIATAVKVQLIKEGCVIKANTPKPDRRKKKKAATQATCAPVQVAGVSDYTLNDTPPQDDVTQTAPTAPQ